MAGDTPPPVAPSEDVKAEPGPSQVAVRPPKPIRITIDIHPDAYRGLRQFATDNYSNATRVVRLLVAELATDPQLAGRIARRISEEA